VRQTRWQRILFLAVILASFSTLGKAQYVEIYVTIANVSGAPEFTCATTPDYITIDDYAGVGVTCSVSLQGTPWLSGTCGGVGTTNVICQPEDKYTTVPSDTYEIEGTHFLYLYQDPDDDTVFDDPLGYTSGYADYEVGISGGYIYPPGSDYTEYPEYSTWELDTTSASMAAEDITPDEVTLGPSQPQQFTANSPSTWAISPTTAGTMNTQTGAYTAPATISSAQAVTVSACSTAISGDSYGLLSNCTTAEISLTPGEHHGQPDQRAARRGPSPADSCDGDGR
jgi:hypothetical protein